MSAKLNARWIYGVLVVLALLAGSLGCGQLGGAPTAQPEAAKPTPTAETARPTPTEPVITTINGPEGMVLTLEGEALTENAEVTLEVLTESDLSTADTPFEAVGPEFRVGFGEGEQIGGIILTVPLSILRRLQIPPEPYVHAAWARPDMGLPSMVGVLLDEEMDLASMPIVGPGRYQIVQILQPDSAAVEPLAWQPLAVPSYWQQSCGWCSTTTITDVAGYHEGAWPSGGYGGVWGESSQWYLAGLGGQACPRGFFFHWLLKAGGYTTPEDVKQDFSNGNAEVIIWNWMGLRIALDETEYYDTVDAPDIPYSEYYSSQLEYANALFSFFHAYVETNVWGQNGGRRPVAWGSALAHHSRVITGSDGENLFFNNPSSGSLNDSKSWDAYQQEVIASVLPDAEGTEIIDTAIFYADPRPASERRGVLWLTQWSESREGSLVLRRGEAGTPAAYWHWDGADAHDYGYYFENLIGDLPADPTFDAQFKAFTPDDVVEYGFAVRSITDSNYDFVVKTELFSETGKVQTISFPDRDATVNGGGRADIYPAGSFPIGDLDPGPYRLKFTLSQGGVVQDVKYVFFQLAPRGYILQIPIGVLKQNALCRKGPGTAYSVVTGFETGQQLILVGVDVERRWGKFEAEVSGNKFQCWISLNLVETGDITNIPVLAAPILETQPVCQREASQEICTAAGGTWKFTLAGVGYCECP
jgi:hypothetical protein